ncbi:MAG: murein biosynthesis integral membrane protein MurJ [Gammaproteobacteria bacterium]
MSVLRNTSLVGGMTFLSRVTGMVRDQVYSVMFGAGTLMDAFLVAFKIPNFLRRVTGEGAFSQAFVPVVAEYRQRNSADEQRELIAGVMGTFGVVLAGITALGVIAAPLVILLFAPGFESSGPRHELAIAMLRWTFPYIFFISLTALAAGVVNTYGRFGAAAFNPVLLNLVMIVSAAFIAPRSEQPGLALAIGVFVAGGVQLATQLWGLKRLGLLRRPRFDLLHEGVRRVGRLMLPGIFGSSVAQISLLLDTWIASFLVTGSIAWMYYADRLVEFPMGVFSIALATVILPGLSAHHAAQSGERFNTTLDWALRLVFLVTVPAAVGLFTLAGPLCATIYGYGEFKPDDVIMASHALMTYSIGLLAFSLVKVLAPGYFSRQDTRTPVRVGLIALSTNMGFNLLVVAPYAYFDGPSPHALLALSTGIGAYVNSFLLWRGLRRQGIYHPAMDRWRRLLLQLVLGNLAMAAFLWWAAGDWQAWTGWHWSVRVGRLAACVVGGMAVYAVVVYALGLRPADLRVPRPPASPLPPSPDAESQVH